MDTEILTSFTSIINSVGFPIFVAIYMLIKGSKDQKELKESINQLTIVVSQQTELFKAISNKGDKI